MNDNKSPLFQRAANLCDGLLASVLGGILFSIEALSPPPNAAQLAKIFLAPVTALLILSLVARRKGKPTELQLRKRAKQSILRQVEKDWMLAYLGKRDQLAQRFRPSYTATVDGAVVAHSSLAELFQKSNERLVIVGNRQSGKTLLLAELISEVRPSSDDIDKDRIPVILLASSWFKSLSQERKKSRLDIAYLRLKKIIKANILSEGSWLRHISKALRSKSQQRNAVRRESYETLEDWFLDQLETTYDIDSSIARKLLADDELIFFLDGIDQSCCGYEVPGAITTSVEWSDEIILTKFLEQIDEYCKKKKVGSRIHGKRIALTLDENAFPAIFAGHRLLSEITRITVEPPTLKSIELWLSTHQMTGLAEFLGKDMNYHIVERLSDVFTINLVARKFGRKSLPELENEARALGREPDLFISECFRDYFEDLHRTLQPDESGERYFPYSEIEVYVANLARMFGQNPYTTVFRIDEISPDHLLPESPIDKTYKRSLFVRVLFGVFLLAGIPSSIGACLGWYLHRGPVTTGFWPGPTATSIESMLSGVVVLTGVGGIGGILASLGYVYGYGSPSELAGNQRRLERVLRDPLPSSPLPSHQSRRSIQDRTITTLISVWAGFTAGHPLRALCIGLAFGIGRGVTVAFSLPLPGHRSVPDGVSQGFLAAIAGVVLLYGCLYSLKDIPTSITIKDYEEVWNPLNGIVALASALSLGWSTFLFDKSDPFRALLFGACMFVFVSLFLFRKHKPTTKRIRPNRAIDYARDTASKLSLTLALICAALVFWHDWHVYHDSILGIANAVQTGFWLASFFFLGGLTFVKHSAMLWTLAKFKLLPRRDLLGFLEQCVLNNLLRTSGGGFTFPNQAVFSYLRSQGMIDDPSMDATLLWRLPE